MVLKQLRWEITNVCWRKNNSGSYVINFNGGGKYMTTKKGITSVKHMQKFSEPKKRNLTKVNISQMKSVNKFCNVLLHTIIKKQYRPSKKTDTKPNFLSAAEKLWYVEMFLENKIEKNNILMDICKKELINTHVSNYYQKLKDKNNDS